jgi:hypothetical protein
MAKVAALHSSDGKNCKVDAGTQVTHEPAMHGAGYRSQDGVHGFGAPRSTPQDVFHSRIQSPKF